MNATPITAQPEQQLTQENLIRAAEAMRRYGGSFAAHIGGALLHADLQNRARLVAAFPDLIAAYKDISK